jgi:hypothetical protein
MAAFGRSGAAGVRSGGEIAGRIEARKHRDIAFVMATKRMQDCLEAMFPGSSLGAKYEQINENMFHNDFLKRITLK